MKRTFVALLVSASLLPFAGPSEAVTAEDRMPGPTRGRQQLHFEDVPRADGVDESGCTRVAGPFQQQAERYLRRPADGEQSTDDCRAIRRFQKAHRISPASGYAGPVTGAVVRLMGARRDPNRAGRCPDRPERTACVDLGRQLLWVQQKGRVVFAPVPIRSGVPSMATRTGTFRIYHRSKRHVSSLYHSSMPFAQFFDGGEALHGVSDDIYEGEGSHGCVNLFRSDARALWNVLKKGDMVHVWGRKPSG
ncbi:L,D-transpeptidase family protein [Streptomyces sp. NPDC001339]|uniref:L,D-transpeptidase family protein n=1 Tax=Streptomyces sp. NPDC001339 TaxID=3364563 RepID=UPI003689224A